MGIPPTPVRDSAVESRSRDDNNAQRESPSFLLPVDDQTFLLSDEMRSLRFAMEYTKAELGLRKACICSTIVVFGSARAPSPERMEELRSLRTRGDSDLDTLSRRVVDYQRARSFARLVSLQGGALNASKGCGENVIATGGGPGIMEAANRGAMEAGAPSIGFNITLPTEQQPNAYTTPGLTFRFHYFAMRKMHLAMRANALAVFPGGFGTLDELFEILTLLQTRKAPPLPVILFGREYWSKVIDFEALAAHGMISRSDLRLFTVVDEPAEGWDALCAHGLTAHLPVSRPEPGKDHCDRGVGQQSTIASQLDEAKGGWQCV